MLLPWNITMDDTLYAANIITFYTLTAAKICVKMCISTTRAKHKQENNEK